MKEETFEKIKKILKEENVGKYLLAAVDNDDDEMSAIFHGSNADFGAMIYHIVSQDEELLKVLFDVAVFFLKEKKEHV